MTYPKIERIETCIVDLPTIRLHHLSMTVMKKNSFVIIRLFCSDGVEGIGESTTIGGLSYGEESPEAMMVNLNTYFIPLLLGMDATNIHAIMNKLEKNIKGNPITKSGIETALLDAQGKRLGVSVSTLLGGSQHTALDVLWTLASGDTEKDIAEAEKLIAENRHNTFKIKTGWQTDNRAVEHVIAIKKALGARAKVTVDVNQAWDEGTAKIYIKKLQENGIDLIEQPINKENFEGLARLTQTFEVPIMADESQRTLTDAFQLAKIRGGSVFALKIGKSGGLYNVLKVAAIAEASDIGLYGGTLLEGSIGTIASAHAFSTLKNLSWGTELFGPLLLTDDIIKTKLDYSNGTLSIPTGPGLGLELDEDKLNQYKRK
ncbi:muconate/chloromuconate family cycloisomerase [Muricauda sp. 334s03]|uniref:Muconate/chloromuconate family cycloisomerase n=2 Tax=Flagellimonas TaxID=444459 RepID=A0ABT5XTW4_9FLAO|nr:MULTISPECIES: muconate/chloromuconate family cycloisomerase [Allomuricauda]MDF0709227.1 muconate/chloromuconate family cycloisomerase [[Muricauda] okinawensis]MDF0717706.1 muconate/chloromuconate family cycloisomerase [[Muricauda] yonaguniensis]